MIGKAWFKIQRDDGAPQLWRVLSGLADGQVERTFATKALAAQYVAAQRAAIGLIGSANRSVLTRPAFDIASLHDTQSTDEELDTYSKMLEDIRGMPQAASELSKALTRPPGHGGYREGSGRKTILTGGIKRTFVLTQVHLEMIDTWGRGHNIGNRSAALRHLIEARASTSH